MAKVTIELEGGADNETFEGDFNVSLAADGQLIVTETVPDVTGESKTGVMNKIVAIFNSTVWEQVGIV